MNLLKKILFKDSFLIIIIIFVILLLFQNIKKTFFFHINFIDRLAINHLNTKTFISASKPENINKVFFLRQINFFTESNFVKRAMDFHFYWDLERGKIIHNVKNENFYRISFTVEKYLNQKNIEVSKICSNLKKQITFKYTENEILNDKINIINNSNSEDDDHNILTFIKIKLSTNNPLVNVKITDNKDFIFSQAEVNLERHYTTYKGIPIHFTPITNFSDRTFLLDAGSSGDWFSEDNKNIKNIWILNYFLNNKEIKNYVEISTPKGAKIIQAEVKNMYCEKN